MPCDTSCRKTIEPFDNLVAMCKRSHSRAANQAESIRAGIAGASRHEFPSFGRARKENPHQRPDPSLTPHGHIRKKKRPAGESFLSAGRFETLPNQLLLRLWLLLLRLLR